MIKTAELSAYQIRYRLRRTKGLCVRCGARTRGTSCCARCRDGINLRAELRRLNK